MTGPRVEKLSDHVGDLVRLAESELAAALAVAQGWASRSAQAEAERRRARRARPLWRKVLGLQSEAELAAFSQAKLTAEYERHVLDKCRPFDSRLAQRRAGLQAEADFVAALAPLGGAWVVFQGYKNRGGEIDATLVGPYGVWAVEVKNEAIHLRADGPEWVKWKAGPGGRPVGPAERAADRGGQGRSWCREVGDPARALARLLGDHSLPVPVRTAVLVLNPRARIVSRVDSRVDLVGTTTTQLLAAIGSHPPQLDFRTCTHVAELIRADHRPG